MTSTGVTSWCLLAALAIGLVVLVGLVGRAGAGMRVMPWGPPRRPRPGFARRAEIRALLGPRASRRPSKAPGMDAAVPEHSLSQLDESP